MWFISIYNISQIDIFKKIKDFDASKCDVKTVVQPYTLLSRILFIYLFLKF